MYIKEKEIGNSKKVKGNSEERIKIPSLEGVGWVYTSKKEKR